MNVSYFFSQKNTVKTLFGGVITNNVVSLVSSTMFHLNRGILNLKVTNYFLR